MDDDQRTKMDQLEFLVREYQIITEQVCEAFLALGDDETPPAVVAALDQLATAINNAWEE